MAVATLPSVTPSSVAVSSSNASVNPENVKYSLVEDVPPLSNTLRVRPTITEDGLLALIQSIDVPD